MAPHRAPCVRFLPPLGRIVVVAWSLGLLAFQVACADCEWRAAEKLDQGLTLVLPGILGHQFWDETLAKSLQQTPIPTAIEVWDWTKGPLLLVYNAQARAYRQEQAQQIARHILDYQSRYPGRPVHLIGHSGGASLAIQVLEALPPGTQVSSTILLAAGLPPKYDLRPAMERSPKGIHNFYSNLDLAISGLFALTMQQKVTAGIMGFDVPAGLEGEARARYEQALHQHEYKLDYLSTGNPGGHFGWTTSAFVRQEIAPLLTPLPDSSPGPPPESWDPPPTIRR